MYDLCSLHHMDGKNAFAGDHKLNGIACSDTFKQFLAGEEDMHGVMCVCCVHACACVCVRVRVMYRRTRM